MSHKKGFTRNVGNIPDSKDVTVDNDLRCQVCDYCPGLVSDFYSSLKTEGPKAVSVTVRKDGRVLCNSCFQAEKELLLEDEFYGLTDDEKCGTISTLAKERKPDSTYMDGDQLIKVYKVRSPTYIPESGSYAYLSNWTEEQKEKWRDEYAASLK